MLGNVPVRSGRAMIEVPSATGVPVPALAPFPLLAGVPGGGAVVDGASGLAAGAAVAPVY